MQRGLMVLAIVLAGTRAGVAAGAVAIGMPSDVASEGVSMGMSSKYDTMDEARASAITECKKHGSAATKALCKVVATFQNQCVSMAIDPEPGTPGFGWAIADNVPAATDQAVANCRDSAGASRRDACVPDGKPQCDGTAQ